MEIMSRQKKKKLFILTILLIASCEMMRGELVCDIRMPTCVGVCYKSGKCMRCCKRIGFPHGRCSFIHGMGCYCCDDLDPPAAAARRIVGPPPPTAAPPPLFLSPHA